MELNQVLELYPEYCVTVTLFNNVLNIGELREMLVKGKLKAALINATMVPDILAVLVAANKAVHLNYNDKLKTRNVHSEVLFNLSPSNNITESFKMFGLGNKDSAMIVVMIHKHDINMTDIASLIKGSQIPLTKLQCIVDENKIKKVYKIADIELSCGSLTDAVITRIATKDAS